MVDREDSKRLNYLARCIISVFTCQSMQNSLRIARENIENSAVKGFSDLPQRDRTYSPEFSCYRPYSRRTMMNGRR